LLDIDDTILYNDHTGDKNMSNYYDSMGYDNMGYDIDGFDRNGFNCYCRDKNGYNEDGRDIWGRRAPGKPEVCFEQGGQQNTPIP